MHGRASAARRKKDNMTEWGVVGVIVVLVGLFTAICVPMIKASNRNTKAMTELTVTMQTLAEKLTSLESNNTESHRRLWKHNENQDRTIQDHEIRIVTLEQKGAGK